MFRASSAHLQEVNDVNCGEGKIVQRTIWGKRRYSSTSSQCCPILMVSYTDVSCGVAGYVFRDVSMEHNAFTFMLNQAKKTCTASH